MPDKEPVTLFFGKHVMRVDVKSGTVEDSEGGTYKGSLLVGADGIGKVSRQTVLAQPNGGETKDQSNFSIQCAYMSIISQKELVSKASLNFLVDFVGREDILESIAERLKDDDYHNRVALTGLGGIGKSQIAIEFAYRWQQRHQDRWVFWVPVNNKARFIDAYREIARVAKIDSGSQDMLDSVHTWLSDEENGRWLMIVDNADSRDVLFGRKHGESNAIQSRIPQVAHGCVLITSRNQTGIDLSGDFRNLIEVLALQEAEALELRLERDQAVAQAARLSKYLKELFDVDASEIPAGYGAYCHNRSNI